MKSLSISFLISLLFFSISCIEEEYTQNKETDHLQQKNNIINRSNDSIHITSDTIRVSENVEPCIGWDCQKID